MRVRLAGRLLSVPVIVGAPVYAFGEMPDIGWTPTLVTQRDGSALIQSGWGLQNGGENLALETEDAYATTAPVSAPTTIRQTVPLGFEDGSSSAGQFYEPIHASSPRRILHRLAFLVEPNWNWGPANTLKKVFTTVSGANSFYTAGWGPSASAAFFGVGLQGLFSASGLPQPGVLSQNLNEGGPEAARITEGQWLIAWTEITGNTAGQENARIRQWVDRGAGPVLTLDQNGGFAFTSGNALMDAVNIIYMRGGSGPGNPSACFAQFDDFTLWRDAA
jgi:hypothetical protein